MEEHHKDHEKDEVIDFGKLKNKFTGLFKKNKSHTIHTDSKQNTTVHFFKDNQKWLIPLFCILIAISFSVFMRIQPAYLPITDQWAENTIHNSIKSQIEQGVNSQYPNLPNENRAALIDSEFQQALIAQKTQIEDQKKQLSAQYKSRFQDDDGQTYLLAIDPYYWYGLARNRLRNGHYGDEINEAGESVYTLRDGRIDKTVPTTFNPVVMFNLYRFMHIFNSDVTLLKAAFYLPLLLVTLSIIPIFFITRKIAGNVGALFAGVIFAVNGALLGRTPAGFADTDPYNVFFPALIAWMLLLALDSKNFKERAIYGSLCGLFTGLFARSWSGWGFMFDFVLATFGILFAYFTIRFLMKKDAGLYMEKMKHVLHNVGIYLLSTAIFVTLFKTFTHFTNAFFSPVKFMKIKDVAVTTVWPNVMTTVAEFNKISLSNIMNQMGGKLLFALAVSGILITLFRRGEDKKLEPKYFVLLVIWFVGTTYAFTKGTRFAILMVPAFAIAFGITMGFLYKNVSQWLSTQLNINFTLSKVVILIILALFLVSPVKSAYDISLNEIPSFTDSWSEMLQEIHDDSDDGIITTWWDFGHWFVAMGERRVTFDGGDQGKRIHWVGRSLLTDNEEESVAILKMLNCGQEKGSELLNEYIGDDYKGIMVLKKIIMMDKTDAADELTQNGLTAGQIDEVLKYTHCDDLIDNYYIASEDMVGKAGVWGHFGSWNFTRAKMFNIVSAAKNYDSAMTALKDEFGLTDAEADKYYYEIKNGEADKWISPWPSYVTKVEGCNVKEKTLLCSNGLEVDLETMDAYVHIQEGKTKINRLAYINADDEFVVKYIDGNVAYGAALIPDGNGYKSIIMSVEQTASMFTRLFFFEGYGLKNFKPFSDKRTINGLRILTYKLDWESTEPVIVDKFLPTLSEVRAKHILLLVPENSTEEEKTAILDEIKDIRQQALDGGDFSELALEYSDDGSRLTGGDLGWFSKGKMVPEFEAAAFNLELGEVSEPVLTQFGYHIIKQTGQKRGDSVKELDADSTVEVSQEMLDKILNDNEKVDAEPTTGDLDGNEKVDAEPITEDLNDDANMEAELTIENEEE